MLNKTKLTDINTPVALRVRLSGKKVINYVEIYITSTSVSKGYHINNK